MAESFAAASTIVPDGEHRFRWDVPDGWQQGKGAFGGLVLGALLRAMEACEPDPARRTRSLSGEIPAPVLPGATEIAVEVLRRGGGTTFLAARALQGGVTVARASALCALSRPATTGATSARAPAFPPPGDGPVVPPPVVGGAPRFTSHYEYRALPPFPFSGAAVAGANGWLREHAQVAPLDGPAVIGLLDAWWPASFACERTPRRLSTVTFSAQILVDPATLDAAAPFAYRAHLDGAADGFTVEIRELWQGDILVGLNQQLFAVLG